ncbi:MAG: tRNA-(ms[2]io[6]A)-hydroxylase [Cyclobacteriaceae bacterium]
MVIDKHVLGLELPTDPRWVGIAEMNIREILIDHAYCEQKAASSVISLIILFHDRPQLVETLSPVVSEEWDHFQQVLRKLSERGWTLGKPRRDEYVERLTAIQKKGGSRDQQLVEKLLLNALIEARSCERFRLLWKEIADEDLRNFYYKLMVSEAGHYKNFISLAKQFVDPDYVQKRWKEWLEAEAEIIKNLEVRPDRMH